MKALKVLRGALAGTILVSPLAWAQPAATTTFDFGNSTTDWTDALNWDAGLPDAADDAWIGSGQTAAVTSAYLDANLFGTLTLDTNSTLQLSAAAKTGLPPLSDVYFKDGSYLQLTAGNINRSANYNIVAGASATFKPAVAGSDSIVSGNVTAAADSEFTVRVANMLRLRWVNTTNLGTTNYISDNGGAQYIQLTNFGGNNVHFGPGTTVIDDKVRIDFQTSNRINDSATLKLVGGTGNSNPKVQMGADKSDTLANLIIDSPTGSGPYIQARNGWLKATNSVSFEGTAGTVQIDNNLFPSTYEAGLDVRGADLTFGGTGSWALTGDGQLRVDGSTTITTNTDATISNYLYGSGTIQKYGDSTLTLSGNAFNLQADGQGDTSFSGYFNVNAGELAVQGAINGINVTTGAELTIGTAASAADTLTLGAGGLSVANGAAINWLYNGAGVAGTDYDTIVSAASLDLSSISNLIINGTSLGYEAQIGDSFTLFNGAVTGFDAGKFTLNLPTLTSGGEWAIQEGSLVLVVVPEASSLLLGALGSLVLLRRRR